MNSDTGVKVIHALARQGIEARVISADHLPEILETVRKLVENGSVSHALSDKWHFYLDNPIPLANVRTIIVAAIRQPVLRLGFTRKNKLYRADIAPNYIFEKDENLVEKILHETIHPSGFRVIKARLPLKTAAVRSGLAAYGKNNLSYVPGIGSFFRLAGFYTDYDFEDDSWHDPEIMPECRNCSLCEQACPVGGIERERFLIHAEKCIGALCERNNDYTFWVTLQPEYLQAFIGCMVCQFSCPVNKPYLTSSIKEMPPLDETETQAILDNTPLDSLPEETLKKLGHPSHYLYAFFTDNLKALIRKQDSFS